MAWWVKNLPEMQGTQEARVQSSGWEDPLEEGMATHSSILAWRTPWTGEPGGLLRRVTKSRTRLKRLSTSSVQGAGSMKEEGNDSYFIEVEFIYNVVLVSVVQSSSYYFIENAT